MNEIIKYIFFFLIGTTVLNLLIALLSRLKTKSKDYNLLIIYWVFLFVTYFSAAKLNKSEAQIGFAYFFQTVTSFILIRFLSRSRGMKSHIEIYLPIHVAGMVITSILLLKSDLSFTLSMIPVTTTMCLPFIHPIWNTLVSERADSNWIEKCMAYICLSAIVNHYNYAFFRLDPDAAWWGWSISIAQYQSMSVFLPLLINHHRNLLERMHVGQVMEKLSGPQHHYEMEIEELYRNLEKLIVEKDELNKQLTSMNSHLEEEREMNEILIKTVSHDIANPLTVIKSYVEMMQSSRIPKDDHLSTLEKINQNSVAALAMIKRIRNAIVTRNQSSLTKIQEIPVLKTLRETLETFDSRIKDKDLAVEITNNAGREVTILADGNSLKEHVFANVITNAIKFSYRKSTVRITISELENHIRIEFIDSGIGISQERLDKKLMQAFEGTEGEMGSGLGFVLMGYFLRKFGGHYQVMSEGLEKGTTVRLDLRKSSGQSV